MQPVDKTIAEYSGIDGVHLHCVQLGGQHQQVLRVPHYTPPHPLPPAVERGEQSREAPQRVVKGGRQRWLRGLPKLGPLCLPPLLRE